MESQMNSDGGRLLVPTNHCSSRMLTAQKRLLYYTNLYGGPMDVDIPPDVVSFLANMLSELELYEDMDVDAPTDAMDVDAPTDAMDVDAPTDAVSSLSDMVSEFELYEPMDVDQ
jgi:hypothetical protein